MITFRQSGWLILALLLTQVSWSREIVFYLGTHTHGNTGKGIYQGTLNTETGQLSPLQVVANVEEPTYLALSPDQHFLYAALEINPSTIDAFKVGPTHELIPLNSQVCGGINACYLTVDGTGQNVLAANYESGDIACVQRNTDGTLGNTTAFIPFSGSGPYLSRQAKPHAHGIFVDPSNQFVYACDLGTDHLWTFRFQAATGTLTPANPPFAKVPPGSGCRHLAQSADGRFVWVNNEMGMSVSAFSRDLTTGHLTLVQTISMLPKGIPPEPNTSAEIVCAPSGHYLYISNRTADTISCFRIASDGTLDSLKNTPSKARFPRCFAIDSSGKWLLIAGEKSNDLALFQIDPTTGTLAPTNQSLAVPAPVCVLFADKSLSP